MFPHSRQTAHVMKTEVNQESMKETIDKPD